MKHSFLLTASLLTTALSCAQVAQPPLPDVPTLMKQVEDHQHKLDEVRENYTYHETVVTKELDKKGNIKKTESEEDDIFFVNGHEIHRTVKKNGKELSADDQKKEQEHVQKDVEKATKTPPGQSLDKNEVSVTRLLQIMKVSNPRREQMDNRSVIAFDFVGDPHAKTHGMAEDASKKLSGTIWIDEKDRQVRHMIARFDDNFHLGFGLFSVGKGSTFAFDQKLVNNELWLPTGAQAHVVAHAIGIIGWRGDVAVTDNDYKKFHADAEQQSGATVVKPQAP
jgi:outer membrane lipoprotein-sorting protein